MPERKQIQKQAVFSAFLYLLDTEKLSDISVGEITERAQVHRNTFYYRFHSLDDLIDQLFQAEADRIRVMQPCGVLRQTVRQALRFLLDNERALRQFLETHHQQKLVSWLHTALTDPIRQDLNRRTENKEISSETIEGLVFLITSAVEGCVLHALYTGEPCAQALEHFFDQSEELLPGISSMILDRLDARSRQAASKEPDPETPLTNPEKGVAHGSAQHV